MSGQHHARVARGGGGCSGCKPNQISAQARVMHPGKVRENADVAVATVNDSDFIVD
jgi:hypothetical protein